MKLGDVKQISIDRKILIDFSPMNNPMPASHTEQNMPVQIRANRRFALSTFY